MPELPHDPLPELTENLVLETLREVIDPELGCNIVDLGLIYSIQICGAIVTIKMTLTTQGCPMHESIAFGVQSALLSLPQVDEARIEIVWDPPWSPDRLSLSARELLGIA